MAPTFFNTGGKIFMDKKKIKELIKELEGDGYPQQIIDEIVQALTTKSK